jgi:hypothetical protein
MLLLAVIGYPRTRGVERVGGGEAVTA